MKDILIATAIALLVPALFWCGGYNFDHRGDAAVGCFMATAWVWFGAFSFRKLGL